MIIYTLLLQFIKDGPGPGSGDINYAIGRHVANNFKFALLKSQRLNEVIYLLKHDQHIFEIPIDREIKRTKIRSTTYAMPWGRKISSQTREHVGEWPILHW